MNTPLVPVGLERRDFLKSAAALGLVAATSLRAASTPSAVDELVRESDAIWLGDASKEKP